jgi:hypothetical protein
MRSGLIDNAIVYVMLCMIAIHSETSESLSWNMSAISTERAKITYGKATDWHPGSLVPDDEIVFELGNHSQVDWSTLSTCNLNEFYHWLQRHDTL